MQKFKVLGSCTGLEKGEIVTAEKIEKDHANLGGVDRLITLGAIEAVPSPPVPAPSAVAPAASPAAKSGRFPKSAAPREQ